MKATQIIPLLTVAASPAFAQDASAEAAAEAVGSGIGLLIGLVIMIIVGAVVGWLASLIVKGGGMGFWGLEWGKDRAPALLR